MPVLRIACVLALAAPALATDPPGPAVKDLFAVHSGGWMLNISDDGSGKLVYGAGPPGDTFDIPAGTFKAANVRKTLSGVKADPKGSGATHFVYWLADEKKPEAKVEARYTTDETVIVPLLETAAKAGKVAESKRGKELLKASPFGSK